MSLCIVSLAQRTVFSLEVTLALPGLTGRSYSCTAPQWVCLPHVATVDSLELTEKVEVLLWSQLRKCWILWWVEKEEEFIIWLNFVGSEEAKLLNPNIQRHFCQMQESIVIKNIGLWSQTACVWTWFLNLSKPPFSTSTKGCTEGSEKLCMWSTWHSARHILWYVLIVIHVTKCSLPQHIMSQQLELKRVCLSRDWQSTRHIFSYWIGSPFFHLHFIFWGARKSDWNLSYVLWQLMVSGSHCHCPFSLLHQRVPESSLFCLWNTSWIWPPSSLPSALLSLSPSSLQPG